MPNRGSYVGGQQSLDTGAWTEATERILSPSLLPVEEIHDLDRQYFGQTQYLGPSSILINTAYLSAFSIIRHNTAPEVLARVRLKPQMDGHYSPWNSDQRLAASDEDSDLLPQLKASPSGSEGNREFRSEDSGPVSSLHLSGRIISVTFTIPYRLQAREGENDWVRMLRLLLPSPALPFRIRYSPVEFSRADPSSE